MTDADRCGEMHLLLQAELDGEISAAEAAGLAAHLASCADCRHVQAELRTLTASLRAELPRYPAPPRLRAALSLRGHRAAAVTRLRWWPSAAGFAAGVGVAAAVMLTVLPTPPGDTLATAAVAGHIRALQLDHLIDVPSSDRHTVKPWFDGRLDYAPPVRDLAAQGFPLAGGRLDYLAGRPVAALIYRRDRHVINLFVWPAPGASPASERSLNGYNVVSWQEEGMRFLAVSDLNAPELDHFAELWHQAEP